jgi:hypothetical protein
MSRPRPPASPAARRAITLFDLSTGAALAIVPNVAPGEEARRCIDGVGWIDGEHDRVDPTTGEGAPLLRFAVTVAANRISGIPDGAQALCRQRPVAVIGGAATFAVDYAADVAVDLTHPLRLMRETAHENGAAGGKGWAGS